MALQYTAIFEGEVTEGTASRIAKLHCLIDSLRSGMMVKMWTLAVAAVLEFWFGGETILDGRVSCNFLVCRFL